MGYGPRGVAIGHGIGGGTDGSLIFIESDAIAEDNTNLFWDDASNILKVKEELWVTSVPAGVVPVENTFKFAPAPDGAGTSNFFRCINSNVSENPLVIQNQDTAASHYTFLSLGVNGDDIYLGTSSNVTLMHLNNVTGLIINADISADDITCITVAATTVNATLVAGTTVTGLNVTSGANPGHTHDETSIGIDGGTTGSVIFLDGSQHFSQDNTHLFWDDSNNRLGVGTPTPQNTLDVTGSTRSSALIVTGISELEDDVYVTGGKKVIYDS